MAFRERELTVHDWKPSLQAFFDTRAEAVSKRPSLAELCFIAGREPRLWSDQALFDDMINSIIEQCDVDSRSAVLEVGCAGGFIARGVAPRVRAYHGVDLAPRALRVARRLGLANARYSRADGGRLQFRSGSFDAAFCYDVFTNFPDFADGAPLIREMFRVVRPGGRVFVGSIPDGATRVPFEAKVAEFMRCLDERYGPPPAPPVAKTPGWRKRIEGLFHSRATKPTPQITTYYFERKDFERLGLELGAPAKLVDIHQLNPYYGFRFNAIYRKPL